MDANAKNFSDQIGELEKIRLTLESLLLEVRARETEKFDSLELCKSLYKFRSLRGKFLPDDLFGEPAWDIMIDLYIAHHEGRNISVTSAGIASGAAATTALRWIALLEEKKLIIRYNALHDKRIIYLRLTDDGLRQIDNYFSAVHAFRRAKIDSNSEFVVDF
ncbi:MAG: hypothetical protein ABI673_06425 [Novosphingobium sp.]